MSSLETFQPVTNGADASIELELPYSVEIAAEGTSALLFHRWNNESVAAKAKAAKGSKAKKTDDIESYVYRDKKGEICIPGEYFRQSIIEAAKYAQDPRSPRKSARDLFKAGIVVLDELCSLGTKDWDYLDQRRVLVQRNGVTRMRPAFAAGWKTTARFTVLLPEYINPHLLHDRLSAAGRLVGVGDFRPTYGRFNVTKFELLSTR